MIEPKIFLRRIAAFDCVKLEMVERYDLLPALSREALLIPTVEQCEVTQFATPLAAQGNSVAIAQGC